MNNKEANNGRKLSKKTLIIICCALVLVLVTLIVVACQLSKNNKQDNSGQGSNTQQTSGDNTDQTDGPMEMVIHSIEEQSGVVCVTTSYCTFTYPYAFSDIVSVEAVNDGDRVGLAFSAYIKDSYEPMYNLWINGDQGVLAGNLTVEGQTYPLNLEIIEHRADLEEDYLSTFFAAQETLNDVLQSMQANGSFEYAVD